MNNLILVTGGAGFIGSNFVLQWLKAEEASLVNIDYLTYAGNLQNLESVQGKANYSFIQGDIRDRALLDRVIEEKRPRAIIHFAAESHVDRSIHGPEEFVSTNVLGTFQLAEAARQYWTKLPSSDQEGFRFLHVSTDEVYGSLGPEDPAFSETTAYAPNSPYSASKAGSDHLIRAYFHTYGFPTLITNCSNNYGPRQFPEKLIPLMIHNALKGKQMPVYGDGLNVRDWLYVEDHCEAIRTVLDKGTPGGTYNIGGRSERKNIDVVRTICSIIEQETGKKGLEALITFVKDRPGHDRRYAINSEKIETELGWRPVQTFETGMCKTIRWYLENADWVENITTGAYQHWIAANYAARG